MSQSVCLIYGNTNIKYKKCDYAFCHNKNWNNGQFLGKMSEFSENGNLNERFKKL